MPFFLIYQNLHNVLSSQIIFIRNEHKHLFIFKSSKTFGLRAKFKAPLYSGFILGLVRSSYVRPSVHMYQCGSRWAISVESDTEKFYENLSKNSKFG